MAWSLASTCRSRRRRQQAAIAWRLPLLYNDLVVAHVQFDIKRGWLQMPQCQAHYLVTGNGPNVVLLHGGAADANDWAPTMHALYRYCRVYAPDLIGYGLTDKPKASYSLEDFADFVETFMAGLQLGPAVIGGHSLGGRIAIEVARRSPYLVSKLVLIDTSGFCPVSAVGSALLRGFEVTRQVLRRPQPHPRLEFDEADSKFQCLDKLEDIMVPTLIVWGRLDPYYPASCAEKAARLLPNAQLEIVPWTRHGPHKERPETVHPIMASFINPAASVILEGEAAAPGEQAKPSDAGQTPPGPPQGDGEETPGTANG